MNDLQERNDLKESAGLQEVKRPKSRQDRVKNIAIIFLAVMLLLTFFSNSILNMSLPQVSGQYAGYGSITTSIRGTGTVAANMAHSVQLQSTRKIQTVYIKAGDTVEAGQVLFGLEDADSTELQEARTSLQTMEYNYSVKLVQSVPADYAATNQEIANLQQNLQDAIQAQSEVAGNKAALDAAKASLRYAQDVVSSLNEQISALQEKITAVGSLEAAGIASMTQAINSLNAAKSAQTAAQNAYDRATEQLETLAGSTGSTATDAQVLAAQRELEALRTELARMQDDYDAMEQGKDDYDDASAQLAAAQAAYDRLGGGETVTDAQLTAARRAVSSAEDEVRYAQEDLNTLLTTQTPVYDEEGTITGYESASDSAITAARRKLEAAQDALSLAQEDLSALEAAYRQSGDIQAAQTRLDEAKAAVAALTPITDAQLLSAQRDIEDKQDTIAQKQEDLSQLTASIPALTAARAAQTEAKNNLDACKASVTVAEEALNTVAAQQKALLNTQLDALKTQLTAANRAVEDAQEAQTEAAGKPSDQDAADNAVKAAQQALSSAVTALSSQMSKDDVDAQVTQLGLENDLAAIETQRALVEKLESQNIGTEVLSQYAGVIAKVNVVSGDTANAGDELAAIDVEGKGYTLSLTVTTEQSRQVHVGDQATVSNYWWGDLTVTLAAIKADRNNPGQSKVLEFTVDGDVTDGQSLDISVGDKQTNYDLVVPNSAIREDSNGTFILVATSKSTVLGTRYTANRVDVTVLTKDSYNSAIDAGNNYGYEYVITTSTKPLEAGSQVRLVDG